MSNLLCLMFGHMRTSGWYGDGLYGEVAPRGTDGIGRLHGVITASCDRCGDTYVLARLHLNSTTILDHLAKHRPDDLREALKRNGKVSPPFDPRTKPTIEGGWI
jgi:hypothetical protein